MSDAKVSVHASSSAVLADLVDLLTMRIQAGEKIDWEEVLVQHPEHAGELRRLQPALMALDELSQSGASGLAGPELADRSLVAEVLGDFRILRPVGRGGMGVVYEAEQLSLGRRVALKILPFAAALDPRQLQRFKNEAQAAATLQHQNIVPVYFVGAERGVHFYVMQFIDGQSLSTLIDELRDAAGINGDGAPLSRRPDGDDSSGSPRLSTLSPAGLSTDASRKKPALFEALARLGLQAAEALEHAHQMGVIHRDIKPGNLLVDARGNLWITDFGLAYCRSQPALTRTGDLIGTLRYMSPEQALARREVVDHRTDVYSLGASLYELLTLEPIFTGSDREELLRQIAGDEPIAPRRINKAIPVDLETIVQKAVAKKAADRYATAQEMADDLRRYLEDKPIAARRPSVVQHVRRWCRRHKAFVTSALVCAVMAAAALAASIGWITGDRNARQAVAEEKAELAFQESLDLQQQEKWAEALSAIKRAEALLAGGGSQEAQDRVRRRRADLELVATLDKIRLESSAALKDDAFDIGPRDAAYMQTLRAHGLDLSTAKPGAAAAFVRASTIPSELAAALDDWAIVRRTTRPKDDATWRDLLAIARAADPDALRNQVRDALERRDARALQELTASDQAVTLPPSTLLLLVRVLRGIQAAEREAQSAERGAPVAKETSTLSAARSALNLLRKAQWKHPHDFWLNHELAWHLAVARPPQWNEAIRFYGIALSLRPQSALAHVTLSLALLSAGRADDAILCCQEALRLDPDLAATHNNLGYAMKMKGELDQALRCYQKAINLKPDDFQAHHNLANLLRHMGKRQQAVAEFQKATELKPLDAKAHSILGIALMEAGRFAEAIDALKRAIRLSPEDAAVHSYLGAALRREGRLQEAIDAYQHAIRLNPTLAVSHANLAWILSTAPDDKLRDPQQAVAAATKAVKLARPAELATSWQRVGVSHYRAGNAKAALNALRMSVKLGGGSDSVDLFFLAMTHWKLGNKDEAHQCYEQAVRSMKQPADGQRRRLYQPLEDELRRFRLEAARLLGVDDGIVRQEHP
jgi:serine/threonine protein kinase/Flp pilus assembly protein TadD